MQRCEGLGHGLRFSYDTRKAGKERKRKRVVRFRVKHKTLQSEDGKEVQDVKKLLYKKREELLFPDYRGP